MINEQEYNKIREAVPQMCQAYLNNLLQVILSNCDFDLAIEIVERWLARPTDDTLRIKEHIVKEKPEPQGPCNHESRIDC